MSNLGQPPANSAAIREIEECGMKDFMGRYLYIGADIVAAVGHGRNAGADLVRARVLGFTRTMVRVSLPSGQKLIHPLKTAIIKENY